MIKFVKILFITLFLINSNTTSDNNHNNTNNKDLLINSNNNSKKNVTVKINKINKHMYDTFIFLSTSFLNEHKFQLKKKNTTKLITMLYNLILIETPKFIFKTLKGPVIFYACLYFIYRFIFPTIYNNLLSIKPSKDNYYEINSKFESYNEDTIIEMQEKALVPSIIKTFLSSESEEVFNERKRKIDQIDFDSYCVGNNKKHIGSTLKMFKEQIKNLDYNAIKSKAFDNSNSILFGEPGTGKTYLIEYSLKLLTNAFKILNEKLGLNKKIHIYKLKPGSIFGLDLNVHHLEHAIKQSEKDIKNGIFSVIYANEFTFSFNAQENILKELLEESPEKKKNMYYSIFFTTNDNGNKAWRISRCVINKKINPIPLYKFIDYINSDYPELLNNTIENFDHETYFKENNLLVEDMQKIINKKWGIYEYREEVGNYNKFDIDSIKINIQSFEESINNYTKTIEEYNKLTTIENIIADFNSKNSCNLKTKEDVIDFIKKTQNDKYKNEAFNKITYLQSIKECKYDHHVMDLYRVKKLDIAIQQIKNCKSIVDDVNNKIDSRSIPNISDCDNNLISDFKSFCNSTLAKINSTNNDIDNNALLFRSYDSQELSDCCNKFSKNYNEFITKLDESKSKYDSKNNLIDTSINPNCEIYDSFIKEFIYKSSSCNTYNIPYIYRKYASKFYLNFIMYFKENHDIIKSKHKSNKKLMEYMKKTQEMQLLYSLFKEQSEYEDLNDSCLRLNAEISLDYIIKLTSKLKLLQESNKKITLKEFYNELSDIIIKTKNGYTES